MDKSLKRRLGKLNNEGVSLVELLVAILIMGIIVVPLLTLFTSAARTNRATAEMNSAEVVASNVMEAVKVYGVQKTAKEMYVNPSMPFGISIPTSAIDQSSSPSIVTTTNEGVLSYNFSPNSDNKYIYLLKGVNEGSSTYDVRITFDTDYTYVAIPTGADPTPTTVAVNTGDTYDYSPFESSSTLFINPLASDVYYDEDAIVWFMEQNETYVQNVYDTEKARIDSINAARRRAYQEAVDAGGTPTPPIIEPTPTMIPTKTAEEIKNALSRELVVTVERDTLDLTDSNYIVNAEMSYSPIAAFDNAVPANNIVSDTTPPYPGRGFCKNVGVDDLKSIYMFYVPYPYLTESAFDPAVRNAILNGTSDKLLMDLLKDVSSHTYKNNAGVINQTLSVVNNTDFELDFYLALQGESNESLSTSYSRGAIGTKDAHFYSNSKLSIGGSQEVLIKTVAGASKIKIAKVLIEVLDPEVVTDPLNPDDKSNVLTSVESTVEQ